MRPKKSNNVDPADIRREQFERLYTPAKRILLDKDPKLLSPGGRLRRERILRKMSLEQMASYLGISVSYLGAIERGSRTLSRNMMDRLHNALNLSYDFLIDGSKISSSKIAQYVRESTPYSTQHNLNVLLNVCTPEELDSCYNLVHTYLTVNRKPNSRPVKSPKK